MPHHSASHSPTDTLTAHFTAQRVDSSMSPKGTRGLTRPNDFSSARALAYQHPYWMRVLKGPAYNPNVNAPGPNAQGGVTISSPVGAFRFAGVFAGLIILTVLLAALFRRCRRRPTVEEDDNTPQPDNRRQPNQDPLPKDIRAALHRSPFCSSEFQEATREEPPLCAICLQEYEEQEALVELPCHHWFHCACADAWFDSHTTCPTCRYSLVTQHAGESPQSTAPAEDHSLPVVIEMGPQSLLPGEGSSGDGAGCAQEPAALQQGQQGLRQQQDGPGLEHRRLGEEQEKGGWKQEQDGTP